MKVTGKYLSLLVGAGFAALVCAPVPALAQVAPALGAAGSYTGLATNAIPTSGSFTCTTSTINGDVGTTFNSITNTGCTINGSVVAPVPGQVVADFNTAYANLESQNPACDVVLSSTPTSMTLPPGVYCFTAGATMTSVTFTLDGLSTDIWIFKVGTGGTGALTGTSFQVVMAGGGQACNVYWRTAEAATMTDSNFQGTILSGTAITLTRGTYIGRALATTDVTVTDVVPMTFAGCAAPAATTLTTQASPNVVLGGSISDTATLSGGIAPTGTITFSLFGPNNATCAGVPIFTSTVPVSGNGAYLSTPSFTPVTAGTYRWIANYSGDANNAGTANVCNAPNESVVVAPAAAAITTLTTQASPGVALGGSISDTATLSGGAAPTGTITFTLFGPDNATCTGVPIFTSTVPVSGNGIYPSASFTPTTAGTYRWIANYSGDANNTGTANPCNAANENVVVARLTTVLTTQASPGVALGGAINDTATLSGGIAPTGTITFTLFGPDNATCTGVPIFTSTVPVSGNGAYPSASFTPTTAGTYRWIADYSGDANNAGTANACNAPNESAVVARLTTTLTTQASPGVTLGGAVSDTATLSGGSAPTGTITFSLFGPNNATCAGVAIFTSTVPVSGNGTYPSASFTPVTAGTYRWIANYSGDVNNAGTANPCNAPNENVVVAPAGAAITTVTTQASPAVALGGVITDTATLSGGSAPTGTITFRLYGPNDATCTGAVIFTSTVPVNGNGIYSSASFAPATPGTYRWIADYSGDANNAATANPCNAPNENVVVGSDVAAIPTLSEWVMVVMAALLALFGVAAIRRRAM